MSFFYGSLKRPYAHKHHRQKHNVFGNDSQNSERNIHILYIEWGMMVHCCYSRPNVIIIFSKKKTAKRLAVTRQSTL